MSKLVTLWFDKDGVLAQYDYSLYEAEYDAPAPWLVHNAHVFRNLDCYKNMCDAFKRLYEENLNVKQDERFCNMRVLTGVSDGITLSEHVLDGAYWCRENLGLKDRDFYACAVSKESIPISLRNKITKYDVLFDDYMPNLRKWKQAGGTAIKVLNGINSPTTEFSCLALNMGADYLYRLMTQIVTDITTGIELLKGQLVLREDEYISEM